jgi:hypothetical protein
MVGNKLHVRVSGLTTLRVDRFDAVNVVQGERVVGLFGWRAGEPHFLCGCPSATHAAELMETVCKTLERGWHLADCRGYVVELTPDEVNHLWRRVRRQTYPGGRCPFMGAEHSLSLERYLGAPPDEVIDLDEDGDEKPLSRDGPPDRPRSFEG